jgi:hypothetical protein
MDPKEQAYQITLDQISEMEFFSWETIVCLIEIVCEKYRVPLTQHSLNEIKRAVLDEFYGENQPEWDSYELWQWWENLSTDWFDLNFKCHKSPQDFKKNNEEDI